MKVGVAHFPPWVTVNDDGVKGADQELLVALTKRMGLGVEFIPLEFSEILEQLESGQIDIASSLLFRDDRNKYIRYISPPYRTKSTVNFYARNDSGLCIERYIDIAGRRVAVSRGAKYFPTFDLDDRMVKVEYSSQKEAFRALLDGVVDLAVCSGSSGDYYLRELGAQNLIRRCAFSYAPKLMPIYVGVSRKSQLAKRADEMEAYMRYMQESGVLDAIADRYGVIVR